MSVKTSQNDKSGDLDQLLANIDKQLLLKLLDSLIDEQEIKTGASRGASGAPLK